MADILLLEPNFKDKYPPLGLMKISYFHKVIHRDYVRFAKGVLPKILRKKKWDRVYVATLFTFEWEETKKTLEYAFSAVKESGEVYVGGILATLMPELVKENFPEAKIITGLLNQKGLLGLDNDECIDTLTPDYSMLEDIEQEYVYQAHDAYFLYMTRGCGMKCEFCAVQTLEPNYIPYISIKETVKKIDELIGPKRDMQLMDNNVLRSRNFDRIIDEIKELGFAKGAKFINPKTGKTVNRYVDFNQGLDAFLLNEHKAQRLGELAIKPARIAFDHIEDQDVYERAITLCAKNGITHMSNYLLYNGENFSGKGHAYHADTPADLYNRMKFTIDLRDKLNEQLDNDIQLFSFPMRYIPLEDTKRGFIGTHWNAKYLRALQCMLIPTQGKGVSSRPFFEAAFGKNEKEFVEFLAMPEYLISRRGHFVDRKNETGIERELRKKIWDDNQTSIKEWHDLYSKVNKEEFLSIISSNRFSAENLIEISDQAQKRLYLHYLTIPRLMKSMSLKSEKAGIKQYLENKFEIMYSRIVDYVLENRVAASSITGVLDLFSSTFITDLFRKVNFTEHSSDYLMDILMKAQNKLGIRLFNTNLVKVITLYFDANVFSVTEEDIIRRHLCKLNEQAIREMLLANIEVFRKNLIDANSLEYGREYIEKEIDGYLSILEDQLTVFKEVYDGL